MTTPLAGRHNKPYMIDAGYLRQLLTVGQKAFVTTRKKDRDKWVESVSYTHLTLPTTMLV